MPMIPALQQSLKIEAAGANGDAVVDSASNNSWSHRAASHFSLPKFRHEVPHELQHTDHSGQECLSGLHPVHTDRCCCDGNAVRCMKCPKVMSNGVAQHHVLLLTVVVCGGLLVLIVVLRIRQQERRRRQERRSPQALPLMTISTNISSSSSRNRSRNNTCDNDEDDVDGKAKLLWPAEPAAAATNVVKTTLYKTLTRWQTTLDIAMVVAQISLMFTVSGLCFTHAGRVWLAGNCSACAGCGMDIPFMIARARDVGWIYETNVDPNQVRRDVYLSNSHLGWPGEVPLATEHEWAAAAAELTTSDILGLARILGYCYSIARAQTGELLVPVTLGVIFIFADDLDGTVARLLCSKIHGAWFDHEVLDTFGELYFYVLARFAFPSRFWTAVWNLCFLRVAIDWPILNQVVPVPTLLVGHVPYDIVLYLVLLTTIRHEVVPAVFTEEFRTSLWNVCVNGWIFGKGRRLLGNRMWSGVAQALTLTWHVLQAYTALLLILTHPSDVLGGDPSHVAPVNIVL